MTDAYPDLDRIDLKILDALQLDGRISNGAAIGSILAEHARRTR